MLFRSLIQTLTSINSLTTDQRQRQSQRGDNYAVKRERIRLLGADITSNKSLQISSIIRSYALDILSNISYNRDHNMTQDMIYKIFDMLDFDGSGQIDFNEFYVIICILVAVKVRRYHLTRV